MMHAIKLCPEITQLSPNASLRGEERVGNRMDIREVELLEKSKTSYSLVIDPV